MVEDLLKGLSTPGVEVKIKIVDIVMSSLSTKSAELALKHLHEMPLGAEEAELVPKILSLLELIAYKFVSCHAAVANYFFDRIATLSEFSSEAALSLSNIFALIFRNARPQDKANFVAGVLQALDKIVSVQLLTIVFNELSSHLKEQNDIERTVLRVREVIGELPLLKRE